MKNLNQFDKAENVSSSDVLKHELTNILDSLDVAYSGVSAGKPVTVTQADLLRMIVQKLRTTIEKMNNSQPEAKD